MKTSARQRLLRGAGRCPRGLLFLRVGAFGEGAAVRDATAVFFAEAPSAASARLSSSAANEDFDRGPGAATGLLAGAVFRLCPAAARAAPAGTEVLCPAPRTAFGTLEVVPQLGHLADWPAKASGAFSSVLHCGQMDLIMTASLRRTLHELSRKNAYVGTRFPICFRVVYAKTLY